MALFRKQCIGVDHDLPHISGVHLSGTEAEGEGDAAEAKSFTIPRLFFFSKTR